MLRQAGTPAGALDWMTQDDLRLLASNIDVATWYLLQNETGPQVRDLDGHHQDSVGMVDTEVLFDALDDSLLVPPNQNELKVQDASYTKQSQTQQQKKQQKKVKAGSKKKPHAQEPKQQEQKLKCQGEAEGGGIKPKACIRGEYCSCVSAFGCIFWAIRFSLSLSHTHTCRASPHIGVLLCRWSAFGQCRHSGSVPCAG